MSKVWKRFERPSGNYENQEFKIVWFISQPVDLPGNPLAIRELAYATVYAYDYHGAHTKNKFTEAELEDWLKNNDVTLRMIVNPTSYKLIQNQSLKPATPEELLKIVNSLGEVLKSFDKMQIDYQLLIGELRDDTPAH